LVMPKDAEWAESVWHLFVVRSVAREKLQDTLSAVDIQTQIHYPFPPHLQPAYHAMRLAAGSLPIAEAIHREVLSLPMDPYLADSDVERVIAMIRSVHPGRI